MRRPKPSFYVLLGVVVLILFFCVFLKHNGIYSSEDGAPRTVFVAPFVEIVGFADVYLIHESGFEEELSLPYRTKSIIGSTIHIKDGSISLSF